MKKRGSGIQKVGEGGLRLGLLYLVVVTCSNRGLALPQQPILPTELAAVAAMKALESCEGKGLKVSVTVVNKEGNSIVMLRNQDAGPHTVENSYNKAFTAVSFGGAYGLKSTRSIVEKQNPVKGIGSFALPAYPIRGLSYSIGGLNIISDNKIVGGIGVSGSPSGDQDEICAAEGLEAIRLKLNK